jgi:hypothetical protein
MSTKQAGCQNHLKTIKIVRFSGAFGSNFFLTFDNRTQICPVLECLRLWLSGFQMLTVIVAEIQSRALKKVVRGKIVLVQSKKQFFYFLICNQLKTWHSLHIFLQTRKQIDVCIQESWQLLPISIHLIFFWF